MSRRYQRYQFEEIAPPLLYIWVNIDTKGAYKSPEKPKYSCGSSGPPPQ